MTITQPDERQQRTINQARQQIEELLDEDPVEGEAEVLRALPDGHEIWRELIGE